MRGGGGEPTDGLSTKQMGRGETEREWSGKEAREESGRGEGGG